MGEKELKLLIKGLRTTDYSFSDLISAAKAIEELLELRKFVDDAFSVHPNIDLDIENSK